jgi:hypothetical protein
MHLSRSLPLYVCVCSALFFFPLSYFNPYPIIQMPRGGKTFTLSMIMRTWPKALEAVRVGMSIHQTSIAFEVPRSTLADRVSGRYSIETKPGISLCIMGFPIDSIPTKGQFQVGDNRVICRLTRMTKSRTTIYHPMSNGMECAID